MQDNAGNSSVSIDGADRLAHGQRIALRSSQASLSVWKARHFVLPTGVHVVLQVQVELPLLLLGSIIIVLEAVIEATALRHISKLILLCHSLVVSLNDGCSLLNVGTDHITRRVLHLTAYFARLLLYDLKRAIVGTFLVQVGASSMNVLHKAVRMRVASLCYESFLSDLVFIADYFAIAVLILTECVLSKEMRVLECTVRRGLRIEEHFRLL